jgi:predicted secreted hydrolase
MKRRTFFSMALSMVSALFARAGRAGAPEYPPVTMGALLKFPRDYGAHPSYRTEWWYVTGWLQTDAGASLGFQLTFFRSRPALDDANPSHFAPRQLLFANVALSDPRVGRLQHDQRAARSGFALAEASESDTDVHIDDWSIRREADGHYRLEIDAHGFAFAFTLQPTQTTLVNGEAGYSRKGPRPSEASYYYSEPWLSVDGTLKRSATSGGEREHVRGRAWLDHEWSSALLAPEAIGWDWVGIDLDDGGALMAFRIRDKSNNKFWAGGTRRTADGKTFALAPHSVDFTPLSWWRSPHTDARYPIAMRVDAGDLHLTLVPLMEDQEFDSRASTGAIYWEGAVTALGSATNESVTSASAASGAGGGEKALGRGYLELTGYVQRLDL